MAIYAARRISDGLLSVITNVPEPPTNLIQRAIDGDGGIAAEWEIYILSREQYENTRSAYPGRAYLNEGVVSARALNLTSSSATITANGIATVTLTADTGDPAYTGNIKFTVYPPSGVPAVEVIAAVAGVASTTMTTDQVDDHLIRAESVEFGSDEITVEGV